MVIITMRTQSLPLMRMKAGNSEQKYGVLVKLIIRMLTIKLKLLDLDCEEGIIISKKDLKKKL